MFTSDCLNVNDKGHLTIGGVDTLDLAARHGTPVLVMDEAQVRENCRAYTSSIAQYYGGHGMALYASKAFSCKEICRIAKEEGLGLDVVSGGELYTALAADFPPQRIYFHGNNKSPAELAMALEAGVGYIVVDNMQEIELLEDVAAKRGATPQVLLRIKPGVEAHTHEFIRTGQIDSKFGFALETGEAMAAAHAVAQTQHLSLVGIHCHIGSQIFDVAPFELAAEVLLGFVAKVKDELGIEMSQLNLGGGIGIKYLPDDNAPSYTVYFEHVARMIETQCAALGLQKPYLLLEPGRSIPGPAGITLYTVGNVKEIPDVRTYVAVDGGMGDNPRYMMYGAKYTLLNAGKAGEDATETYTVAGRYCESGDLLAEHTKIQPLQPGDVLAVLSTGAYNYSMALNYNRVPKPPVVMVRDGDSRVIVRGESLEDMARLDV
ncbi:MAG: diaminopimelate decarboxylase [Oscillospiraceae bacterium]|nr:diaminopimelate decarboxylase [Oscillospiraceae bacterium]